MARPNDHFSHQAAVYQASRPGYPESLFKFLASVSPGHDCALDCAAGNGQAASDLAGYFDTVIATDFSFAQLTAGRLKESGLNPINGMAESLPLQSNVVDCICVAQAWHWFDAGRAEAEFFRVLKPNGIAAIWGYNLLSVNPAIDHLVQQYYHETLDKFWPPERRRLELEYPDFPSLLEPISEPIPRFAMTAKWRPDRLKDYLLSWSATQRLIKANGNADIEALFHELYRAWDDAPDCSVKWPMIVKVARKPAR